MGYGPESKAEKRFDDINIRRIAEIPGPGQYDPRTEVSPNGTYFVDKFKNSQAPLFTKQQRLVTLDPSETRKITPGPGTYKAPTEFGYYEIYNLGSTAPAQVGPKLSTSKSALSLYNPSAVQKLKQVTQPTPTNLLTSKRLQNQSIGSQIQKLAQAKAVATPVINQTKAA